MRLREFVPGDIDELAAMVADPEQMSFYPRPRTRHEATAGSTATSASTRSTGTASG